MSTNNPNYHGDPSQWSITSGSLSSSYNMTPLDNSHTYTVPNTYQTVPNTIITTTGQIYQDLTPDDELRSKPTPEATKHNHNIQCRFAVEKLKIVAEYLCTHCDTVLFRKVICKIPKKLAEEKCLSKIVKGV
jgi:hypothetical protein